MIELKWQLKNKTESAASSNETSLWESPLMGATVLQILNLIKTNEEEREMDMTRVG